MKIRQLTPENYPKASALLRQALPRSVYEVRLVENLHKNGKTMHEWVCLHINAVIAYIAFTKAYNGSAVCGVDDDDDAATMTTMSSTTTSGIARQRRRRRRSGTARQRRRR